MAEVHNEDMLLSLNTALSSVREALDTTVKIEQAPSYCEGCCHTCDKCFTELWQ
jgi:hypothetical protein